jgi:hypothetical protein
MDNPFRIFPSIAKDEICFTMPCSDPCIVRITSTTGAVVLEESITHSADGLQNLNISGLAKGTYIISIQTKSSDYNFTSKFSKL